VALSSLTLVFLMDFHCFIAVCLHKAAVSFISARRNAIFPGCLPLPLEKSTTSLLCGAQMVLLAKSDGPVPLTSTTRLLLMLFALKMHLALPLFLLIPFYIHPRSLTACSLANFEVCFQVFSGEKCESRL